VEQWPFIPGRLYNRHRDIHERFGGQQRGGISTPQNAPGVFIFTGAAGAQHGYADSWQPDGSFHYCGEGQSGDMRLIRGNRAIASHAGLSRDLLLFETTGKGRPVRYVGQFVCAGWFKERLPDTNGLMRDALIFKLVPLAASSEALSEAVPEQPKSLDEFKKLRMRAYAAAKAPSDVAPKSAVTSYFVRSQVIRDYALARAGGNCEHCGSAAPFETSAGTPFLEVHHIERLTDGGPDSPSAVAALCPNCHREAHLGKAATKIKEKLKDLVRGIEKMTAADLSLGKRPVVH
jgi:5-methylcytosine-specific restriction protein A